MKRTEKAAKCGRIVSSLRGKTKCQSDANESHGVTFVGRLPFDTSPFGTKMPRRDAKGTSPFEAKNCQMAKKKGLAQSSTVVQLINVATTAAVLFFHPPNESLLRLSVKLNSKLGFSQKLKVNPIIIWGGGG